MSAGYKAVSWTRSKILYDAVLIAGIVAYITIYFRFGAMPGPDGAAPDGPTLAMKAFGSCAFVLLTIVLAIGPLARLDPRFLPLLYNRRHFGVITCAVAASHASAVIGWYFSFSDLPPLQAVLAADTSFSQLSGFSFVILGVAAFLILLVMAATSHDFWLAFLGPPLWKAIHMGVYGAYALVVGHVALGALQDARSWGLAAVCAASVVTLTVLHLAAALRQSAADSRIAASASPPWVIAAKLSAIAEGRAVVVHPADGEPVAIFRHDNKLSAVTNACAHQNGPLGEGCVIDGLITCPWHGFQYRLADGCAPPPYTERIATYRLALDGDTVLLDPSPNPPGTYVEPLRLAGDAASGAQRHEG